MYINAGNKDQKLIGHSFEDIICYRLMTAVPFKMYRNLAEQNGFWSAKC